MGIDFDFGDELDASPQEQIRRQAHIVNGGEHVSLVACVKCGGSGQTPWGRCFRCNGNGQISKRSAAASKAKQTAADNKARWQADHDELITFLRSISDWNSYAASLLQDIEQWGDLKPWKEEKAYAMMVKIQAQRDAKRGQWAAERAAAAPAVDVSAIERLFATATENAVKRPIFRTVDVILSKAKPNSRNPGALYVKHTDTGAYCGKIVDGKFLATSGAPDVVEALRLVAIDPGAEAIKYASKFSACGICGTAVVDPVSVLAAVGPVCARKWNLTHVRDAARVEAARLKAEQEQETAERLKL
jgi:hypothetical protein